MSLDFTRSAPARRARQQVAAATEKARPGLEWLARFGFVAKGVVYFLVGFLALKAATGTGGKTTDTTGALYTMLHQPFGKLWLGAVAAGLFGYAAWRLVQAAVDPDREQTGKRGMIKRVSHAANGLAYGSLGVAALRLLAGLRQNSHSSQDWTAWLLAQPFGPWLVGGAGVLALGIGINLFSFIFTDKFRKKLRLGELSPAKERVVLLIGRLGHGARGVVIGMIGLFLIQAARHVNPREAQGLAGVLNTLARQPQGPWLLGAVAAGLMAYGFHQFVSARYRQVWNPRPGEHR